MRFVVILLFVVSSITAGAQRKYYYDENENPVKSKEESFFYAQTISNKKECIVLQFYTEDNSKKKEMPCRPLGKHSFTPDGIERNYSPGGKPWFTRLWREGRTSAYIQYWILGFPQLLNGSGIVRLEDEEGNFDIQEFRDSIFVRHFTIDLNTKDSVYDYADETPEIPDGFLEAMETRFASLDNGGERGMATIDFAIEKDGTITGVTIRNGGLGPVTNKLIETEFPSIGKWTPGKFDGKPVKHVVRGINILF